MKNQYKQGLIRFDKNKEGKMYAQLRNEHGQYGKRITISEDVKKNDLIFANQLDSIKESLDEMIDILYEIDERISEVLTGLHNDRIGLYYSGINLYLEALQTSDIDLQKQLIAQSLKSLSDSQSQLIQEFKTDLMYLKSADFRSVKKKKHEILVAKMQNIHDCFKIINRIINIKAMIYFDNQQLSSMMMVYTEYQRFISAMVKPNAGFLIECDPRSDKLINGLWERRSNIFSKSQEIQNLLKNQNQLYINMED